MKQDVGWVMKSTGMNYSIMTSLGEKIHCRVRGKMRLEDSKESNPVAVGDRVSISYEGLEGHIHEVLPRKNHMVRKSVKKTAHTQVLAANIDLIMVMATLKNPRTSLGFIDRILVTAEAFQIPQIIVFNKSDLLKDKDIKMVMQLQELYDSIGVPTILTSALDKDQDEIKTVLSEKITLVAGHSGVGKSTLFNQLSVGHQQVTSDISTFSGKGMHTTTFVEMFDLDLDTFIIDTPGINEWGLIEMSDQEMSDYFPEMRCIRSECKFGARCVHVHEPECAVLSAVEDERIAMSRYESYISMLFKHDNRR